MKLYTTNNMDIWKQIQQTLTKCKKCIHCPYKLFVTIGKYRASHKEQEYISYETINSQKSVFVTEFRLP